MNSTPHSQSSIASRYLSHRIFFGLFFRLFSKNLFKKYELLKKLAVLVVVLTTVSILSDCSSTAVKSQAATVSYKTMAPISIKAVYTGHGSIGQAYELGAVPGTKLYLVNSNNQIIGTGIADRLGSLIIRNLPYNQYFTFRSYFDSKVEGTKSFKILSPNDTPPNSFYSSQKMHVGLNYITMRDGVKLAATVRLPNGATMANGPFPTVIEWSGYPIAGPHSLIDAFLGIDGESTSDPLVPSTATAVGSLIAPLIGFATVSLQMRGSGCSGGAFGLFDLPTIYDAYDSIEIVASQSWVKNHKVGMVGISFSGFSQIFAAGTRPPGLAAIAPMSIANDFYYTGFPGGMLNTGFAVNWIEERWADAQPAPQGGQTYAKVLIADGDKTCLANQALRLQTPSVGALLGTTGQRTPSIYNPRSAMVWAKNITVPTFLVGAVQDEQVGGQWPEIISSFSNDPNLFVTMTNGTHGDSLGEYILSRWIEFLYIYVADEVPPKLPTSLLGVLESEVSQQVSGVTAGPPVPLRFTNLKTAAQAKAAFKKDDPRVRVLFDNGGEASNPGEMRPEWEADFNSWPPKRAQVKTTYLGSSGKLSTSSVPSSSVSFRPNPALRPATTLSVSVTNSNQLPTNDWDALPTYNWAPVVGNEGLGFISPVLKHDMVVVGPASLNLWVKSTAVNTDLQVTVSEVRPNGLEMYVQSGYLRASYRKTEPQSTALLPIHSFTNPKNLTFGKYSLVRIGILPILYAFRAGSRIRITITAPGGDLPVWQFNTFQTNSKVVDTVGLGGKYASTLVLPVINSLTPPDPQPPCPSLRGEPCRAYVPAGNGG